MNKLSRNAHLYNKMAPKAPILISWPSGDMLHADFCVRLATLCLYSAHRGIFLGVHNVKGTLIEISRGIQAWEGLRVKSSHILFLDSDMSFPPNTLERLLQRNKDIVGCTYCQRRSPRGLTHESLTRDYQMPTDPREDVFEVKSLGFGCILIRTSVFERVPRPWFKVEYPGGIQENGAECHRSEDRTFCDRAREVGYKVWCDATLSREIRHCGQFEYGLEHAEIFTGYLPTALTDVQTPVTDVQPPAEFSFSPT
jgi:hypothetical protein